MTHAEARTSRFWHKKMFQNALIHLDWAWSTLIFWWRIKTLQSVWSGLTDSDPPSPQRWRRGKPACTQAVVGLCCLFPENANICEFKSNISDFCCFNCHYQVAFHPFCSNPAAETPGLLIEQPFLGHFPLWAGELVPIGIASWLFHILTSAFSFSSSTIFISVRI